MAIVERDLFSFSEAKDSILDTIRSTATELELTPPLEISEETILRGLLLATSPNSGPESTQRYNIVNAVGRQSMGLRVPLRDVELHNLWHSARSKLKH